MNPETLEVRAQEPDGRWRNADFCHTCEWPPSPIEPRSATALRLSSTRRAARSWHAGSVHGLSSRRVSGSATMAWPPRGMALRARIRERGRLVRRTIAGIAGYVVAIMVPFAVALAPPRPEGRGLTIDFGVAIGFVAFAMLGIQFLLTARFPRLAAPYGLDGLLRFHRVAGVLALIAVLTHILTLIAVRSDFRAFLDPFDDLVRAGALWMLLGALVGLVALTIWRKPLGIPYQWWRLTHGALALFVIFVTVVHIFRVGHYSAVPWKMAVWAMYGAGSAGLLVWTRVVRPIRSLRRPWRVIDVRAQAGRAWTVALEPDGHPGMPFRAGQFAWLVISQRPWHIDAHPFSFSSSSELARTSGRVEFTIKELGDFTATIGSVPVGSAAYLDGPYGDFVLDESATGAVFVVGGIGVTPALSIIRTMRDRGDTRPVWLVYGVGHSRAVIARDELEALSETGRLHLTLVAEASDEHWSGERGLITDELLARVLPPLDAHLAVFCCGPRDMMDAVLPSLRALGAGTERLRAERYDLA